MRLSALVILFTGTAFCQQPPAPHLSYRDHQWFAFRDAVRANPKSGDFERAVVACTFNDLQACEQYTQRVLASTADTQEKAAAHDRLSQLYMALGRAAPALPHHQEVVNVADPSRSIPDPAAILLRAYAALPEISAAHVEACSLPYNRPDGELRVPVTINGRPGNYFLDTGAGYSAVSESEARRVGLRIVEAGSLQVAGFTGATAPVTKVAIAEKLEIGKIELKNVPFLVLPSEDLMPQHGGALGLQVLIAIGSMRWDSSGAVQLAGQSAGQRNTDESNLCLDANSIRAQVTYGGRKLDFKLDTGGGSFLTDLFAQVFPDVVKGSGYRGTWRSGGFGARHAYILATFLPEVELSVGTGRCTLHHAAIVQVPGAFGHGLLGFDVLKDARAVTLDFRRMMMTVE